MPRYSDSNYAAVTRKRRYASHIPTVAIADSADDGFMGAFLDSGNMGNSSNSNSNSNSNHGPFDWPGDVLEPDDVDITRHEAAVAPLLEEGELDADAIVVSPTGNSSSAANVASERRRREDGWNDLALEQFVEAAAAAASSSSASAAAAAAAAASATAAASAAASAADPSSGGGSDEAYDPASPEPGGAGTPQGDAEAG
jgi:Apc13p protein